MPLPPKGTRDIILILKANQNCIFSSPEPKARVSYCRPFSSVIRFRPSSVMRRASCVNFLHFHLLLENAWLDFNQTWQESSLGVGDSKLFKQYVWPPWGPRGRAPKGQNHANFKHLLLQIQKENSQVMQCVDTLLDEEQKLFMAVPRVAPMGPCGPFVKSNCFIFFLKMQGWILTKHGRNHPQGLGIQSCSYGTCGSYGGPGGGPQRAKTMQISNIFFSRSRRRIVKLCSVLIPCQMKNKSCSWQFPGWPQWAPVGPL